MKRIPIVIPSLEPNEKLIQLCKDLISSGLDDIVIVNDGSDETYNPIFKQAIDICHGMYLKHDVNKGKGAALKTAFTELLKDESVIGCITADSDGQHTPSDIKRCKDVLIKNPNCLILGVRNFNKENVPFKNKLGNKSSIYLFSFLAGVKVSDTQTGLRVIPSSFMKELLEVKENRFEFETKMLVLSKKRYPIKEVSIETVYEDEEHYSTHYNPFKDSMRIFKVLIHQFGLFMLSSLSSSGVDLALFTVFVYFTKKFSPFWYAAISTVLARILSATYNYLINYHVVFKSKEKKSVSSIRYIILAIIQMTCSAVLITIFVQLLKTTHTTILKAVVDSILFLISYQIQKRFVF